MDQLSQSRGISVLQARPLLLIALLFLLAGCRNTVSISEHRCAPRKPTFTISPPESPYGRGEGIDFDAVYCTSLTSNKWNVSGTVYRYYRFWPNGRVLSRHIAHPPTGEDAEDFSDGHIGYYRLNNRRVTIELFVPDSGTMNWGYETIEARLADNVLEETEIRLGERTAETLFPYSKLRLDGLRREPDW